MTSPKSDPEWAWFDGHIVPFSEARLPIEDRAVQFGEALYEVIAVLGGTPFRLADHVERMAAGARELGLEPGLPPAALWPTIIEQLHRRQRLRTAILYAQLTGGVAPRSHLTRGTLRPCFFAYLRTFDFPTPADVARGVAVVTTPESRWQQRQLKTTMLLPAVLAKREAVERGADEAVFVGRDGFVNEGASTTVFAVKARTVATPPNTQRILAGVTGIVVREICEELGIAFRAQAVTLSDLATADELFVASTTMAVMPVVRLDGRPVGPGTPGPLSLQIAYHFQRRFWGPLEP
jgi:D-alanine transaminase